MLTLRAFEGMKLGNNGHASNTTILTYRPKPKDTKVKQKMMDAIRAAAGCVHAYCKDILEKKGGFEGIEPKYDSCKEVQCSIETFEPLSADKSVGQLTFTLPSRNDNGRRGCKAISSAEHCMHTP